MKLNDEGIKLPQKAKTVEKKELEIPDYFLDALKTSPKALEAFDKFSLSQKKEYVFWISEAKRVETRNERMKTAISWIEEGKKRNWKYEK